MEYTALLAGEPFSDAPSCVDGELAAVLRHANDKLSATGRSRLVPLLGRSIGLTVPEPLVTPTRRRLRRRAGEWDGPAMAQYAATVSRLRQAVSQGFTAALGHQLAPADWRRYASGRDVDRLFWDLMHEPAPVSSSAAYVDRLVSRLGLLHECYEQAMDELQLPRSTPSERESSDVLLAAP